MAVTIDTGLGTGSRDRDMMMLQGVLQNQLMMADRFMAAGAVDAAIDLLPKILNTMKRIASSAGLKNPDEYYPDFTEEKVAQLKKLAAQPKPNPVAEAEKAKAESAMQLKQVDAQVSMQQAELKAQGDVVKNQAELDADLQTKEADRQNALILQRQQAQFELEKQARDHAFQLQLEQMKMANAAHIASLKPEPAAPAQQA